MSLNPPLDGDRLNVNLPLSVSPWLGVTVPPDLLPLHHGRASEACDTGPEQSRPVSSASRAGLETLPEHPLPPPALRLLHLAPWDALQHK